MGNAMPFVVQLALRSIAGFLIQIVPCAALCLMPFAGRLRGGRRVFAEPLDASVWWHMKLLPLMLIATFLLGYQLPPIPNSQLTVTLRTALCVTSVVLLWWTLRMALDASKSARRQARLQDALDKEQHQSQDLSEALACARERVRMLGEEVAAAADAAALSPTADAKGSPENSSHGPQGLGNLVSRADEPVVLMSAHQAVSLMPGDIAYVESLNRMRVVHLTSGESVRLTASLSDIYERLPHERFAYRHRSIVVNLALIRHISSEGVLLADGSTIDASRRHISDLRKALNRYREQSE